MKIGIISTNKAIYSTTRINNEAVRRGHSVKVVNHLNSSILLEASSGIVFEKKTKVPHFDAIIPRIGALTSSSAHYLVKQYTFSDVITTADPKAIEIANNKLKTLQVLAANNIPIPKTVYLNDSSHLEQSIYFLGQFPIVLKILNSTQGIGVILCESLQSAKATVEAFLHLKQEILIQEFIKESSGVDYRAYVVGDKVVAAMQKVSPKNEFRANFHRGSAVYSYKLKPEEEEIAIKAAKAVGLAVAGVDFILSERGPLILEVNASGGLEGIERCTGKNVAKTIIEYLENEARFQNK